MKTKRAESQPERAVGLGDEDLAAKVAGLMKRVLEDDDDAVWELRELAEPSIARQLRSEARRLGVSLTADDLFGLVTECVLDLADLAGSWRPGEALPWVWARHRMGARVHRHIGVFADPLDELEPDWDPPLSAEPIEDPWEVLEAAASRHPAARRLRDQLRSVASERDARIWLGIRLEQAAGNRSPAVTVGADHGMKPEAVRKAYQRVGERLTEAA